jgi:nicotinamide-nucleotide amidase
VSEPVARMMALKASERTGSTYALSVTGVAGPSGGSEQAPVGTVCIGVAHPEGCQAERFHFLGDRIRVRTMAVQTALDLLRRRLQGDLKRT